MRGDARADGARAAAVRLLGPEAVDGGLVDIEFAAQYLQLIHAAGRRAAAAEHRRGPGGAGRGRPGAARLIGDLADAWRLQQDLSQLLQRGDRPGRRSRTRAQRAAHADGPGRPASATIVRYEPSSPAAAAPRMRRFMSCWRRRHESEC